MEHAQYPVGAGRSSHFGFSSHGQPRRWHLLQRSLGRPRKLEYPERDVSCSGGFLQRGLRWHGLEAVKDSRVGLRAHPGGALRPPDPLTQKFTFNVGYAITIENIGAKPVEVERIRDLLPPGFSYTLGTTTGDISFNPNEHLVNNADRWRLTWDFNPKLVIPSKLTDPSGSTKTVSFYTTATVQYGDYWNDVLLTIDDDYDDPIYSWPTAVVTVREAFDVEVTGPGGNPKFISIQVIVGTDTGVIARWDIR